MNDIYLGTVQERKQREDMENIKTDTTENTILVLCLQTVLPR